MKGRLNAVIRRESAACLRERQQIDGAAQLLGISRPTLYKKVKLLRIAPDEWRGVSPLESAASEDPAGTAPPGLLRELADLLARYSGECTGAAVPADPIMWAGSPVPVTGFP